MVSSLYGFNNHTIHVDLYTFNNLVFENFIDQTLFGCPIIFQSKRHNSVTVEPPIGDQCSFLLIESNILMLL